EKLYQVDKGRLLTETLAVIRDAFGSVNAKNAPVAMMVSIAWFTLQHEQEVDRNRFVERLHEVGVAAIDRRARTMQATMLGTIWVNYFRVMAEIYNDKLRLGSRLVWKERGASNWKAAAARKARDLYATE